MADGGWATAPTRRWPPSGLQKLEPQWLRMFLVVLSFVSDCPYLPLTTDAVDSGSGSGSGSGFGALALDMAAC